MNSITLKPPKGLNNPNPLNHPKNLSPNPLNPLDSQEE
jgi:hypothetical protein